MLCRIHGILESLAEGAAVVTPDGGLSYEVLLPAFATARLAGQLDQPVTLHTVYYLEGAAQGNTMTPRLIGFIDESDRTFFRLMVSVKGIGPRKALKAMSMPAGQIAAAIADRDVKTLQTLPEIGRRTAETIVAELHGKLDAFVSDTAYTTGDQPAAATPTRAAAREALEVLLQLGENRVQAIKWIDEVMVRHPDIDDAQRLVEEVFRIKS